MGAPEMMFGYWSAWHWLVFAVFAGIVAYPVGRRLNRIGFSPLWSILAFVPIVNLVALWIVALVAWPRDRRDSA